VRLTHARTHAHTPYTEVETVEDEEEWVRFKREYLANVAAAVKKKEESEKKAALAAAKMAADKTKKKKKK
jgi:hypothetical protein